MKNILVIRTDRIGDVILTTPAIEGIKKRFPSAKISVLITPFTKDIIESNPFVDEILIYDKATTHKSFLSTFFFGLQLRKKKFDTILVFHPTNRVHILTFIAGAKTRIGYDKNYSFLLTHKVPHHKQEGKKHEIDYTLDIAHALDSNIKKGQLCMMVDEKIKNKLEAKLQEDAIDIDAPIIIMHPGASCPSKRWPFPLFIRTAQQLIQQHNASIIFIGDQHVANEFTTVNNKNTRIKSYAEQLSLKESLALISISNLLISNDSGPVHMAQCVHTPCIAIFGRKDPGLSPKRWGPTGKTSKIIHKDVGCKKCYAHNCNNNFLCLHSIRPEEVVKLATQILSKN